MGSLPVARHGPASVGSIGMVVERFAPGARRAIGATLRLLVRDETKAARAREAILRDAPGADVGVVTVDMSDLAAIRTVVDAIGAREERIDALVNNADALLTERRTSADGHEATFATMVLGPFVLTNGLLPILERTAEHAGVARVINVASGGMYLQPLHLDDLQMEREPHRGSVARHRPHRRRAGHGAMVTRTDIEASNGVIHVTDAVLLPPAA